MKRVKRLQTDVEVHCGLAAEGIVRKTGQEEPGALRVLLELDTEFALQPLSSAKNRKSVWIAR